jgi:hypothetical protein
MMSTRDLVVERIKQFPATAICDCDLLSDRANGVLRAELIFERCREGFEPAAPEGQYAGKGEHKGSKRARHISPQG